MIDRVLLDRRLDLRGVVVLAVRRRVELLVSPGTGPEAETYVVEKAIAASSRTSSTPPTMTPGTASGGRSGGRRVRWSSGRLLVGRCCAETARPRDLGRPGRAQVDRARPSSMCGVERRIGRCRPRARSRGRTRPTSRSGVPARWAAPSADRLAVALTRTGSPLTSAWSCISATTASCRRRRRARRADPTTSAKAATASSTWKAIDSRAARATCARRVPRVKPLSTGTRRGPTTAHPDRRTRAPGSRPSLLGRRRPSRRPRRRRRRAGRRARSGCARSSGCWPPARARRSSICQATVAQTPEAAEARGPSAITDEPVP